MKETYDHWYLRRLKIPESLLREASEGLSHLSPASRNKLLECLYLSKQLRANFNDKAKSFGITNPEDLNDMWSEGIISLASKNNNFFVPNYFFGPKGLFTGILVDAYNARKVDFETKLEKHHDSLPTESAEAFLMAQRSDEAFCEKLRIYLVQNTRADAQDAYWTIFVLIFVEQMSYEGIAGVMNCTVGAVKSKRDALLKKIGPWLERHIGSEGQTP